MNSSLQTSSSEFSDSAHISPLSPLDLTPLSMDLNKSPAHSIALTRKIATTSIPKVSHLFNSVTGVNRLTSNHSQSMSVNGIARPNSDLVESSYHGRLVKTTLNTGLEPSEHINSLQSDEKLVYRQVYSGADESLSKLDQETPSTKLKNGFGKIDTGTGPPVTVRRSRKPVGIVERCESPSLESKLLDLNELNSIDHPKHMNLSANPHRQSNRMPPKSRPRSLQKSNSNMTIAYSTRSKSKELSVRPRVVTRKSSLRKSKRRK